MGRSLVFSPGCDYKFVKECYHNVMYVEYEAVNGEFKRQRFDLVEPSLVFVIDGHRLAAFSYISDPPKGVKLGIRRVHYREEPCQTIIGGKIFIPTRIDFDTVIPAAEEKNKRDVDSERVKMINDRIARVELNSAYGIVSRDWTDCVADSARYIIEHNHPERKLYIGTGSQFCGWKDKIQWQIEEERRDRVEQWLKEPPKPNANFGISIEFISDDLEDCEKGVPNTKLIDTEQLYFQDITTGEMKPFNGVKSITPKPMHFRGTTWTHPTSLYGRQGHMLIVDPTSKTFFRDDDYLDAEIGDVMCYDDGNNGKPEPEDNGKLFVWLGLGVGWQKLSDDNGYIDTDMTITEKIIEACKKAKEGKKVATFDIYKPKISKVIFNDPATIVFWSDGSKTVVKCGENDEFDPEKGIAMCCMKKLLGTNETGSNYLDGVKEYIRQWREDNRESDNVINTVIKAILNDIHHPAKDVNTSAMDIPEEGPGLTDEALKEVAEGGKED